MRNIICLAVVLVGVVAAISNTEKVQQDIHNIAKSVKASHEYSLEEKKDILANLKEMNKDAKEMSSSRGIFKQELKNDLTHRMSTLKREMHESAKQPMSKEFEEEQVVAHVHAVHEDIKALKTELKSKHLSHSDKVEAKRLVRQLESGYGQLSHETTRQGRREVAISMKATTQKLRKYLNDAPSAETKKAQILSTIQSNEAEFSSQSIPSAIKSKIHSKFEEMKQSLEEESDLSELQSQLKSELSQIKALASKAEKVSKVHQDVAEIRSSLGDVEDKSEIVSKLRELEETADKFAASTSSSESQRFKSLLKSQFSSVRDAIEAAKRPQLDDNDFEEEESDNDNDF